MQTKQTILLAGGSGFIGRYLAKFLSDKGHSVRILTRNPKPNSTYSEFHWDPSQKKIDPKSLIGIDTIINMAGANVSAKRWTASYKKEIFESRRDSTQLLVESLKNQDYSQFIQFSGTGIYGNHDNSWIDETTAIHLIPKDFLAAVCKLWEDATKPLPKKTILRIPPVIAKDSGLISTVVKSAKTGVIGILGSGKQYMPWIHIEDLVQIIEQLLTAEDSLLINPCAPNPTTNKEFTLALKDSLSLKGLVLPVPKIALKIALGGISYELTKSQRVKSSILESQGYNFLYPDIDSALSSLK